MRKIPLGIAIIIICLAAGFGSWLKDKNVVPIIVYHRIERPPTATATGIIVSPENFRKHLTFLKKHRYHVIGLDDFVDAVITKRTLPGNSVIITFDDGTIDNYTQAFPVLKEFGFPATIFMIVSLIDKEGFLTLDQMREMEKHKITFGSHTLGHAYLPGVSKEWQQYQIMESKKVLENRLGHSVDTIAYPGGGFSEEIKNLARQAGYRAACTTNRGYDRTHKDLYEIKRIRFNNSDNDFTLWSKLTGYYNFFRSIKDPN